MNLLGNTRGNPPEPPGSAEQAEIQKQAATAEVNQYMYGNPKGSGKCLAARIIHFAGNSFDLEDDRLSNEQKEANKATLQGIKSMPP